MSEQEALEWADKLAGVAIWMSGASDFASPDGVARQGWDEARETIVLPYLRLRDIPIEREATPDA